MNYVITGGTGSLGQALARRLITDANVNRIVVLSRDEVKQGDMAATLPDPGGKMRYFLGDVRDRERLSYAFYHTDIVIHCAALKRVDAVAYSPSEARKTNVEGSANVIHAAAKAGVGRVLMISSDKAVQPTNFYGVTKAMMEQEAVASNAWTVPLGTCVSCTRWGNVIESRGSVMGVWQQAVKDGRPLLVTNPLATRFWLTLRQAVDYTLEALTLMEGGEIFVPADLPASTLAEAVEEIAPSRPIEIVGMRPGGEKMHETLATVEELARAVRRGSFHVITPHLHPWRWAEWTGERRHSVYPYTSEATP